MAVVHPSENPIELNMCGADTHPPSPMRARTHRSSSASSTSPRTTSAMSRSAFMELGAPAVLGTWVAAVSFCFVTDGWAYSLLEDAQERQADSVVTLG